MNIKINGKSIKKSNYLNNNNFQELSFENHIYNNLDNLAKQIKLRQIDNYTDNEIKSQESAAIATAVGTLAPILIVTAATSIALLIEYIHKMQNSSKENFWSNNKHAKVMNKNGKIIIKKMNYRALMFRITERYHENICKIFNINYKKGDWKAYKKKVIARKADMRIKDIEFKEFFALEMVTMLEYLGSAYDVPEYVEICRQIINNSYLSKLTSINKFTTPLTAKTKDEFREYPLMKHQEEFITLYPYLKQCMNLRGYVLSFDQGLGKTLTSLALGTNLNKDQFIIVCPNTLTTTWADEICDKMHTYKINHDKAIEDIYVVNDKTKRFIKSTKPKFIIVNNEAIEKIEPYIDYSKNTIIIVDECQNFRYLNGQRWHFLINMIEAFYSKNKNVDVLCMSGTPIKAKPSELSPVMMMIDPLFDEEVAKIYAAAFDIDSTTSAEIVNKRFGNIIYRKTKEQVLKLPPKYISSVFFTVENSDQYLNEVVKKEIEERFLQLYFEKLSEVTQYVDEYEAFINKYCDKKCPSRLKNAYLKYLRKTIIKGKRIELHELTLEEFSTFVSRWVKPNITDKEELKRFEFLESKYSHVRNSAMGLAIGEILPKRRDAMFCDIIKENVKDIIKLIDSAEKKVALFTASKKVVTALEDLCKNNDIGYVTITGDNPKDRADLINQFKNDDNIDVLIGTNKTLGVGITITCANVEIIFGPPWRKADFDQLTDRIYRIGQDTPCYVYNVELQTDKPNLSNRMAEIMNWSGAMTDTYINSIGIESLIFRNENPRFYNN